MHFVHTSIYVLIMTTLSIFINHFSCSPTRFLPTHFGEEPKKAWTRALGPLFAKILTRPDLDPPPDATAISGELSRAHFYARAFIQQHAGIAELPLYDMAICDVNKLAPKLAPLRYIALAAAVMWIRCVQTNHGKDLFRNCLEGRDDTPRLADDDPIRTLIKHILSDHNPEWFSPDAPIVFAMDHIASRIEGDLIFAARLLADTSMQPFEHPKPASADAPSISPHPTD